MCRTRRTYRSSYRTEWVRDESRDTPVRAGDDDREQALDLLRRHAADGRLDVDELDARCDEVLAAKYVHELDAVFSDLPRLSPSASGSRRRAPRPPLAVRPVVIVAALLTIAAFTGAWGLAWLIFPLMFLTKHSRRRYGWEPYARHRL